MVVAFSMCIICLLMAGKKNCNSLKSTETFIQKNVTICFRVSF